ncbi:MAG: hypothetical protein ACRDS1_04270 [Pseudonocardiaceae bacterium]
MTPTPTGVDRWRWWLEDPLRYAQLGGEVAANNLGTAGRGWPAPRPAHWPH